MTRPLLAIGGPQLYVASAGRLLKRVRASRGRIGRREERLVFVFGAPRSGTTFLAGAIGSVEGFIDLGEVLPFKALIPSLASLPVEEAAPRIRAVLERVRLLGLVRALRGVEQTPETAFVVDAAVAAYPGARCVHLVRDGRDVVCSLLERGWLSRRRTGRSDDVGSAYGAHRRFWVEPERAEEFERASDLTRAAWAWRRYVSAARSAEAPVLQLSYEWLATAPERAAADLGAHLDVRADQLVRFLSRAHAKSIGRFRRELTTEQLGDVEREAGPLLEELGYL
jgi:Sulfotransferase family